MMQYISNVTGDSSAFYVQNIGGEIAIPLVFILVLALIVMVSIYVVSSLERYQRLWRVLNGIADVAVTAVIGAVTLGVVYVGYVLFEAGSSTVKDVDPMLYVYAACGFMLSVIVGYGVERFVKKILSYHEATSKPVEKKEAAEA